MSFWGFRASGDDANDGADPLLDASRRVTRSAAANRPNHLLLPPSPSVGLGFRPPSRSPSPVAHQETQFHFPSPSSSTMATNDATMRAMVEAATTAALAALQASNSQRKKPELPNFDASNVEIWIKRVESAYIRSNISRPQDTFAFVEQKFAVDQDPKINEFLFGDSTEERWNQFIEYLKNRYGKSQKQQTTTFLRGFHRDGRRPTDMLAFIKDQTKKVTMDSLYKEMIVTSLPADIQRAMADKLESLDALGVADLADSYFDKDGKVLIPSSSINAVNDAEADDDDAEVNAIGRRQRAIPRQQSAKKGQRNFNGRGPSASNPSPTTTSSQQPLKPSLQTVCHYHLHYGDKARNCSEGCSQWETMQQKKGNGQAGNRL